LHIFIEVSVEQLEVYRCSVKTVAKKSILGKNFVSGVERPYLAKAIPQLQLDIHF
jgi:hypothetical protein